MTINLRPCPQFSPDGISKLAQQTFSGREPLPQPSRTGRMMNPQMMEAAQKMMAKMSPEDMERMMQVWVWVRAPRAATR